jgi:ribosomal protein L7/L12
MAEESRELPAAAVEALTKGQKIEAIKIVRQESGLGLKQAKDVVDAYVAAHPILASQAQEASKGAKRRLLWVIVAAVASFLLFRFLHR